MQPRQMQGVCYFARDGHPGTYRPCCNQYMCDYHFRRIDLRAMGAGLELAKSVLQGVKNAISKPR
jgi:hypothetical protein